jgi:hypothetical protein
MALLLTDSATTEDRLNRGHFVSALSQIALQSETPLVIGVFGEWGAGKTSLMRMVETALPPESARTVWFDAWRHQQDETPTVALMHSMVSQLDLGEDGRKLLTVIAAAFGSALLKATTSMTAGDVDALGRRFEEERFQVREYRTRLGDHLRELVDKARGKQRGRIVFFIDELDRCDGRSALKVLEALKLYFDIAECVFFVSADRRALEAAVESRFAGSRDHDVRFLEKIFQLPFSLPPLHPHTVADFIGEHLPHHLDECAEILACGLARNPRVIKRFINVLVLNDLLAKEVGVGDYSAQVLATVQLVQLHDPDRFAALVSDPALFSTFVSSRDEERIPQLKAVFQLLDSVPENVSDYLHLAEIAEAGPEPNAAFMRPVTPDSLLAAIVGEKPLPRTELVKRLWIYIKRNKLQDPANRRLINADDLLRPVFDGRDQVSLFDITKFVSRHIVADDLRS